MPTKNNNHTKSSACTCTCTCRHNLYILPLLSIGSKINLQCVFEYVAYDIACKYILLQRVITKINSFSIKGNSALSFLHVHVVINNSKINSFELFSTII